MRGGSAEEVADRILNHTSLSGLQVVFYKSKWIDYLLYFVLFMKKDPFLMQVS